LYRNWARSRLALKDILEAHGEPEPPCAPRLGPIPEPLLKGQLKGMSVVVRPGSLRTELPGGQQPDACAEAAACFPGVHHRRACSEHPGIRPASGQAAGGVRVTGPGDLGFGAAPLGGSARPSDLGQQGPSSWPQWPWECTTPALSQVGPRHYLHCTLAPTPFSG